MTDSNATPALVGNVGPYRTVCLSKILDPATERRRCTVRRYKAVVNDVEDYHSEIDIMSHLGTHLEAPSHHAGNTKDVTDLPMDYFMGRGVLLKLDTVQPRALITGADMDAADRGRVREGDVLVLDSPYHSEPFVENPNDQRPLLGREASEWCLKHRVKAVGFGDGIDIENSPECIVSHDILLNNDILYIEVMENIDKLEKDIFLITYTPLPIRQLDSCPVNVMAIEGIPAFSE